MVWMLRLTALFLVMAAACVVGAQAGESDAVVPKYQLRVAVNEVTLTFHAADAQGLPVTDLKLDEMKLLDNGRPPGRVIAFEAMMDAPLRAGILLDTSGSMAGRLPANRAIAIQYARDLLRAKGDQAFVMDFGYSAGMAQTWTSDAAQLMAGLRGVAGGGQSSLEGTALYDAVFRACHHVFGETESTTRGRFILLFSDGADNASHVSRDVAVGACQRANTAIYAFRLQGSAGAETLTAMAAETGGRVFFGGGTVAEIDADLRVMEAELRDQYRLVFRPAGLKRDGAFHAIELTGPERAPLITVRSGYYAPVR